MKYVAPTAPQPIGAVIDDAIRLFRASWSRCWLLAIVPGIGGLLLVFALPTSFAANGKPSMESLLQTYATIFTPRVIGFYLLLLIIGLVFQGAVLARQAAIAAGDEAVSAADAIGTGVRRLLSMIVGGILFVIIIGIAFVVLFIPGISLSGRFFGFVALIISSIWLWGRLMLWTPALFVDDQNVIAGLGTSWRLTRGNWWRGTVMATVAIIIAFVLAFVFSFIGGIVASMPMSPLDARSRALLTQVFSIGGNAIYVPLVAAMWIAIYRDFRLRREGGDLESRATALGSAA